MLSEELVVIEAGPSKYQPTIYPPNVMEAAAPLYERAVVVQKWQGEVVDPADIIGSLVEARWTGSAVVAKIRHVVPLPSSFRIAHCVIAQTKATGDKRAIIAEQIKAVEYIVLIPLEDR